MIGVAQFKLHVSPTKIMLQLMYSLSLPLNQQALILDSSSRFIFFGSISAIFSCLRAGRAEFKGGLCRLLVY